jgi:hypothetical protein
MNTTSPTTVKQTHPVRGILWGIPFGLGLAVVLLVTKVIPLSPVWLIVVIMFGIVVGAAWGMFGPAKGPKGPPPVAATPSPAAPAAQPNAESNDAPAVESAPGSQPAGGDPGDTDPGESVS